MIFLRSLEGAVLWAQEELGSCVGAVCAAAEVVNEPF